MTDKLAIDEFVTHFRASAPYIHAHRGTTVVIAFGGEALRSAGFRDLVHDLGILHALGLRIVLVHGARPQIDAQLRARGAKARYAEGRRVTDNATMREVQEAVGTLRVAIEAQLSMGTPSSPLAGARIRVASGNFVVARPLGVVDGVDYQHTGVVRRIDAEGIVQRLDSGAIVLLSPIGYSVTGEVFNVSAHDVAAQAAIALRADKLVALVEGRVTDARRRLVREMTLDQADARVRKMRGADDLSRHLDAAVRACRGGVRRAHLVDRKVDGGLLLELFTRDGVGTLVSGETFEGIRPATLADVPTLLELIAPLAHDGTLLARPRELLENEIDTFTVVERDGLVIGCAALLPLREDGLAEIACVAVRPEYRESGRGEVLLTFLERRARELGSSRVFVLTTRAIHWFRERGYEPAKLTDLPKARRAKVDRRRKSKVLVKDLAAHGP